MKPKIKLFARHLKIERSYVFWWEDSRSGLKIKIGNDSTDFLPKTQNLENSWEIRKISRFHRFLAKKWVKYLPIWILRPDLESSHQNTSDRAIFKCLAKSFIFGFIMGVNWDLFRSALNGDWVKWKTTDAILFPHMMSTIKSRGRHAL